MAQLRDDGRAEVVVMLAASGLPTVGSSLPVSLLVGAILIWFGVLIAKSTARGDSYRSLGKVMIASVVLHVLCAPAQMFVVRHFYNGIADWLRYDHEGAILANNWRSFHFTLAGSGTHAIIGDKSVSIAGGVIMTIVGPDQLAAFIVSAWLSFVGTVFFYRAFRLTFPDAAHRRYALLIFLFPSLLFWTADVSKESLMLFGLGLTSLGMAKVLRRQPAGYLYILLGGALAMVIRPNELVLLVIGFAMAMGVRAFTDRDRNRAKNPVRAAGAFLFVAAGTAVTAVVAIHFVHSLTHAGLTSSLSQVGSRNQGTGAGFGSSSVPFSSNPLWYPRDIFTVLFDPLFFNAHSVTQLGASAENALIFAVVLFSLPQLRCVPRACVRRPYVLISLFYTVIFLYAFAALGNLGLITRERTLVLPLLFVLVAIPLAPKGSAPYPWQERRPRKRRRAGQHRKMDGVLRSPSRVGQEEESDVRAAWGETGAAVDWAPGDEPLAGDWTSADWQADVR